MNVKQMLSLKASGAVETIAPTARVAEAAAVLGAKRFGALVVSHGDGTVSGILSERDIVRGLGEFGAQALDKPVSALMTAKVETCTLADNSDTVMNVMTTGRFRHLPVIENGRMVGLLSIGDVVKARILEIEEENIQMQTMLHG